MEVSQRQAIERKVVRHLIRTAKAHGYALVRVWDGEENVRVSTERDAMDAVFAVDESRIGFKHPSEGGLWDAVMEESAEYADRICLAHFA